MALSLLAGCGGGETSTPSTSTPDASTPSASQGADASTPANEEISGAVNTDGSTSMADVMAAFQESFSGLYPDVTVNYSGTGSGSGITNAWPAPWTSACPPALSPTRRRPRAPWRTSWP